MGKGPRIEAGQKGGDKSGDVPVRVHTHPRTLSEPLSSFAATGHDDELSAVVDATG